MTFCNTYKSVNLQLRSFLNVTTDVQCIVTSNAPLLLATSYGNRLTEGLSLTGPLDQRRVVAPSRDDEVN